VECAFNDVRHRVMTSPSATVRIARDLMFLATMAAAWLTVGCASAGGRWSVPQPTSGVNQTSPLPGAWDRVEALRLGSRLLISLKSGEQVDRAFADLRPDVLVLTDSAGAESSLPRVDVQRIVAVEWRDGLTNGVSIGAGIGLAAALAILTGLGAGDGYVLPSAKWGAPVLLSAAGAMFGAIIDNAQRRDELVYLAPTDGPVK
jgi:hypothetical protein